jgi:hypothetical protein
MHFARTIVTVAFAVVLGGCADPATRDRKKVEDRLTEYYAHRYVRPVTSPIAFQVHRGEELSTDLLRANGITLVEVNSHKGSEWLTLYEDEAIRPPSDGMITGVRYARGIGLFYPKSISQPDVEVRVNYRCEVGGDSVHIHVVVPNPLWVPKEP